MDIKPWALVQFRDSNKEPWSPPYAYIAHINGAKYPHVGMQVISTQYWQEHHCFYSGSFRYVKLLSE